MKLLIRIVLIFLFTYLLSFYAPWWIIFAVSFLVGFFIYGHPFNAFLAGFLGGGILWLSYSWYLDLNTNSILTNKIVALFPFEDPFTLIALSGLVGGLSAGFGALSGNSFRGLFIKKQKKSFYS
ncbi:MAG: hypothetical protein ACI83W_001595 [Marinoscillum sp.]|jgi:hypothetical protein